MPATIKNHTLWPAETIHVPGFFISLVAAPLIVTAVSFWAIVPVFALLMGGPAYLALGTPTLLWLLSRRRVTSAEIAAIALAVNMSASLVAVLAGLLSGNEDLMQLGFAYLGFGALFAPLWGLTFGWLYNGFLGRPEERPLPASDQAFLAATQPERT